MINCTEEKPKLHKYPSFSGLLLVKNGVCEYKYGTFNDKTETIIQSFDSLKISFVFSKKYGIREKQTTYNLDSFSQCVFFGEVLAASSGLNL